MDFEIEIYRTSLGKCPFTSWLENLKDFQATAKVKVRLDRMKLGNFGDSKSVGDGVHELRIDFGPGYRVYYGQIGRKILLLLYGGIKRSQDKDIVTAKSYWAEHQSRGKNLWQKIKSTKNG